jgi:hypothetical protein
MFRGFRFRLEAATVRNTVQTFLLLIHQKNAECDQTGNLLESTQGIWAGQDSVMCNLAKGNNLTSCKRRKTLARPPPNLYTYTKGATATYTYLDKQCLKQTMLAESTDESETSKMGSTTLPMSIGIRIMFKHWQKAPLQSFFSCDDRKNSGSQETTIQLLHFQGNGRCLIKRGSENKAPRDQVGAGRPNLYKQITTVKLAYWATVANAGLQHMPRTKCPPDTLWALFGHQHVVSGVLFQGSSTCGDYAKLSNLSWLCQLAFVLLGLSSPSGPLLNAVWVAGLGIPESLGAGHPI